MCFSRGLDNKERNRYRSIVGNVRFGTMFVYRDDFSDFEDFGKQLLCIHRL